MSFRKSFGRLLNSLTARQRKIVLSMYKPMNPSELKRITGFRGNYVNYVLKEFVEKGIVKCLVSSARTGRIYALTEIGKRLRKCLSENVGDVQRISSNYLEPEKIDWKLYGWVLAGKGKREYLKIIGRILKGKDSFKAREVFGYFRIEGLGITPRTEVYRALKQFVRKGILVRVPEGKRGVRFQFTKKGRKIAELLAT
ncbi:MAG: hypothetical protein AB1393_13620 [Candidatus Edwardsbacteria bacterium]